MRTPSSESGFTLVEIAVVVIVVGILVGGILKGGEIRRSMQVNSTATQIVDIRSAFKMFQDAYYYPPGDMLNPAGTLGNCNATPCSRPGDGNGMIGTTVASTYNLPTLDSENDAAWAQLAAVGLVKGIIPNATIKEFGRSNPSTAIGAGLIMFYKDVNDGNYTNVVLERQPNSGHYIVSMAKADPIGGQFDNNFNLSGRTIQALDKKVDDGLPNIGRLLGGGQRGGGIDRCVMGPNNNSPYNTESTKCAFIFSMDAVQ